MKQLLARSKPESLRVEIISNLTPPNSRSRKIDIQTNVLDYLRDAASHCELILYDQKSDHSNRFHKRAIWTDWWVLQSDRGFNFLSEGPHGKKQVQRENNLFLTGKYASKSSLWNQINNQWESYLEDCVIVG
jgi:hypothetical protein